MPNGNHGATTHRARHGEPQPVSGPVAPSDNDTPQREPTKKDLASWWRSFKRGNQRRDEETNPTMPEKGIFGVDLQTSIRYANVAISLSDAEGKSYVYGYVPIVVAKCGVFLKEKATDVEGIFRLSGSEKRIKELREAFNSPDRYGKGLDWSGYTVHDAANILRRYFNQLPEPIIPLNFYAQFREPLRGHQSQAVGEIDGQSPSVGNFDMEATIKRYQELITQLPPLNRQLLLYILDLLAVFAAKSDLNKMTTANLAAIFQPGVLSHPQHDMAPPEYRLSQDVLIFLIENQDHFLIGMQGTAVDAQTVHDVESGPPTPAMRTPGSRKSIVGRSGSNASKYSAVRRSVSVSSKQSRGSVGPTPVTPTVQGGLGGSGNGIGVGIHRSNTVPTKRSPALTSGRVLQRPAEAPFSGFVSEKTPTQVQPAPPEIISPPSSEQSTPLAPESTVATPPAVSSGDSKAPAESEQSKPDSIAIPAVTDRNLSPPSGAGTPSGMKSTFKDFLSGKSPPSDGRKPNKLQKKRLPGSQNPSANSSSQSLEVPAPGADQLSIGASTASNAPLLAPGRDQLLHPGSQLGTPTKQPLSQAGSELKPSMSPTASFRSHSTATEPEGLDQLADAPLPPSDRELTDSEPSQQKKRHWFSRAKDDKHGSQSNILAPQPSVGQNDPAQRSRSSVVSGGAPDAATASRKSVTVDRAATTPTQPSSAPAADAAGPAPAAPAAPADDEAERGGRNPLTWIKGKVRERAEKKEEQRAGRSPAGRFERSQGSLAGVAAAEGLAAPPPLGGGPGSAASGRSSARSVDLARGRSFDAPRPPPEQKPAPVLAPAKALPDEADGEKEAGEEKK